MHTHAVHVRPERTVVDSTEHEGWVRVGQRVAEARKALGFTNRKAFAESCGVSDRLVTDLETGNRANFSARTLALLEEGLGWPIGTMGMMAADDSVEAPEAGIGGDLQWGFMYQDPKPVQVEVPVIQRAITALTDASRVGALKGQEAHAVGAALVRLSWPYVIRLIEDNCQPGKEVHRGVRPLYESFEELAAEYGVVDASARYARWLAGDLAENELTDKDVKAFWQRLIESRRARPRRHGDG
ncbi:hypothetical protein C1S80_12645 [Mycolicibacterium aubagnense]|nr:hypothetical protein C1S80_12645 [Mycolicibacterium aubagnense]